MSLLDQRKIDEALFVADGRVHTSIERVRGIMFADGPDSAPPGFDNVDSPERAGVLMRYMSRQAEREKAKVAPGNLAQTVMQHPAVQELAAQPPGVGDPNDAP